MPEWAGTPLADVLYMARPRNGDIAFEFKGLRYILTVAGSVWKLPLDRKRHSPITYDSGFSQREREAIRLWAKTGGFGGLTVEQFLSNVQP